MSFGVQKDEESATFPFVLVRSEINSLLVAEDSNNLLQVSFGVHEDEESAARQYDRALLIEKGRAAKTNFPLPDYEKEAKEFEDLVVERCALNL